jgi:L-aspartate oxidase
MNRSQLHKYSTIVIGSGIAGLYTALKIADSGIKLALLTKSKLGESNTRYAQGGVAAVLPENTSDSIDLHVKDTLEAGAGLSDPEVTRFISERGAAVISNLIKFGVPFDRDRENNLAMTLEGAHSVRRVLHAGGDATGRNIEQTLVNLIKKEENIDLYEEYQAVELLQNKKQECKGLIAFNTINNDHSVFVADNIVLATGGLTQVYQNTTNPKVATGDGVALAYRAGADIQDMEFVQFHPTAFHSESTPRFLISESVRGEGAKLRNIHGELFAHKYHPKADLAPRDIVTRAIISEQEKTGSDHVYLDATIIPEETLNRRFPNIIKVCKEAGIDIKKDYIPVSPAAHYSMGGIKVDIKAQTTIPGLYAVGEVACTSLHGANRLASNSLLECVVLAEEVADCILIRLKKYPDPLNLEYLLRDPQMNLTYNRYFNTPDMENTLNLAHLKNKLKKVMWAGAGVKRNEKNLISCMGELQKLEHKFNKSALCFNLKEYEFRNMLIVSKLIVKAAVRRLESRGAHYREDFPKSEEEARHSYSSIIEIEADHEFFTTQVDSELICAVCS